MTLSDTHSAPRRNGGLNGHNPFAGQPDSGERVRPPMELEWAHEIQPRESAWLVKGLIPERSLMAIYGPSRAGKSFLALEWALRLASGDDVLGMRARRVGVAYVAPEAPNGVRKRVRAWMQERGGDDVIPFALIGRSVDFTAPETEDVAEVIELLQAARIEFSEHGETLGLVFVDTLARAMPGADENVGSDMGRAIAALEEIGRALGVTVCMVHHTGKEASRGLRGHSSLFAALDCAIELTLDDEAGNRRLKIAKQKDDEDGREWAFTLRRVTLGLDADGDEVTSCVVDYADAPPPPAKKRGGKVQAASETILLEALKAVLSNQGRRAPAGVPCGASTYVAPRDVVREHAFKIGLSKEGETAAAGRTRFNRAQEALVASKKLGVWANTANGEEWLWLE